MSNRTDCSDNIVRLQEKLASLDLDGALITHPIDLYYFSGTRQNGVLWVPKHGEPKLMIRKSLSRARSEAVVGQVLPFPSSKEFAAALPSKTARIGMTFDVLPLQQFNYYSKLLPGVSFSDIAVIIRELRSVKSETEIELMRSGGRRLSDVFTQLPDFLAAGMREVDVAAEFEMRLRKAGSEGYVRMRAFNQELFQGLAVSGDHGCTPGFFDGAVTGSGMSKASPHGASAKKVRRDEPILIDYTGVFDGYILDMTRMFVIGELTEPVRKALDTALSIQDAVVNALRPGINGADLFDLALNMAANAGLGDRFMGPPGEQAKFVGHGVGLELDEMPVLAKGVDTTLQCNQTIAVEPKFVFPGIGVVGIENTFVVGPEGGERLTTLPDDLIRL